MNNDELLLHNKQLIEKLYQTIQPLIRLFLERAAEKGYPLRITHGYRSIEEQNTLYAQGRTQPGQKVTNAKGGESFHNFGLAIDIYDEVRGYGTDWDVLERIADSCGLEHGDRGYVDLPHFQYRGGLTLQEVQSGKRPEPFNELTKEDMEKLDKLYAIFSEYVVNPDTKQPGHHEKNLTFLNQLTGDMVSELQEIEDTIPDLVTKGRIKALRKRFEQVVGALPKLK